MKQTHRKSALPFKGLTDPGLVRNWNADTRKTVFSRLTYLQNSHSQNKRFEAFYNSGVNKIVRESSAYETYLVKV